MSKSRLYCRVPAKRRLQLTARAATRHGARDPLVRPRGPDLQGSLQPAELRIAHLIRLIFTKTGWAWHVTIYRGGIEIMKHMCRIFKNYVLCSRTSIPLIKTSIHFSRLTYLQQLMLFNYLIILNMPKETTDLCPCPIPDSEPGRGPCGIWAGKPSLPVPSPVWATCGLWLGLHRDLNGACTGSPLEPAWAYTNPTWGPHGPVRDIPAGPQAGFGRADPGPARAGPSWESTGLALAQTNPTVPRVARTNPAWDQSGLAIWDTHWY